MKSKNIKNSLSQTRFDDETKKKAYEALLLMIKSIKRSKPIRGSHISGQKLANSEMLGCICAFCEFFFGDKDRCKTWPSSNLLDKEFVISMKNKYSVMKYKYITNERVSADANKLSKREGFETGYLKMQNQLLTIAS